MFFLSTSTTYNTSYPSSTLHGYMHTKKPCCLALCSYVYIDTQNFIEFHALPLSTFCDTHPVRFNHKRIKKRPGLGTLALRKWLIWHLITPPLPSSSSYFFGGSLWGATERREDGLRDMGGGNILLCAIRCFVPGEYAGEKNML